MTERTEHSKADKKAQNRDPISGAPGAHPVGTAAGAVPGGIAGAAAGMAVGGPIGSVIGAAAGAVAGGLAGKGIAESVDPTAEEKHWKEAYVKEPYYVKGKSYDFYAPGYRAGWEGRQRHQDRTFEDSETELSADYNRNKSSRDPEWHEIKPAARSAWDRIDRSRKIN